MLGKTQQLDLLARALDLANLRHAAIAHNLANVNTPNFRRVEVAFDGQLDRLLAGSEESAKPRIVETDGLPAREDGNTVNLETELGLLVQNSLMMTAATQVLALKLSQLRSAITGRT